MNALEMALEALTNPSTIAVSHAIELIRAELAKPLQEPPKREWVGLTDEEILSAAKEVPITCIRQRDYDLHFAPIIEAKLKKKNTK